MLSTLSEVLVPPVSIDLTTLAVLREELEITDHKHDARLTRWIHDASEQVIDYLGRDLARQTVQETFYTHWQNRDREVTHRLMMKHWPIESVTSISVDGIAWDPSFYRIRQPQGEILNLDMYGGYAPWRGYQVEVVYTSGYALLGGLPRAIERATLLLLRGWFASRSRDPTIRSESVANILTQSFFDATAVRSTGAMPPEAAVLLDPHKERFI